MSINETNPYLLEGFAPVADEVVGEPLQVIGEVPRDIDGIYVRNGPNPRLEPRGRYHWFDGDGMLHAARIQDGRIVYRNRWIATRHLERELDAGRALWSGLMEPTAHNPRGAPYKDTANTDVVFHGDQLLASWYICGEPYAIDPLTLETRGPSAFGAEKPLRISAHCKVDEQSGELMFFDYGPRPPYLRYGLVDAAGQLAHLVDIDLPGPRLPHDMAITRHHSVLMDLPLTFSEGAIAQRRWGVAFHRDLPARFGVIPRRGAASQLRWFEAEPCYIYHVANAWEEDDDTIVIVGCRVADPLPPPDRADGPWAAMMANLRVRAALHRWRLDLRSGQLREEQLDDQVTEFPSIDARLTGRPSRYAYHVSLADTPTLRFDGLVKYDTTDGSAQRFFFGEGRFGSEAPFAPRRGATAEDDGYLVSFVHDEREQRSELVIVDAREIERGPVACAVLPQRVPHGFHACWVDGARLA